MISRLIIHLTLVTLLVVEAFAQAAVPDKQQQIASAETCLIES